MTDTINADCDVTNKERKGPGGEGGGGGGEGKKREMDSYMWPYRIATCGLVCQKL